VLIFLEIIEEIPLRGNEVALEDDGNDDIELPGGPDDEVDFAYLLSAMDLGEAEFVDDTDSLDDTQGNTCTYLKSKGKFVLYTSSLIYR